MADARPLANDPVADARSRLADLLAKHPEMEMYTLPASEGSVRDVVKRLDEIAELLRRLMVNAGRAGGGR